MTSRKRIMKRKSSQRRGRWWEEKRYLLFLFAESIESEQIKMNDTKQMKARETITHWQELMVWLRGGSHGDAGGGGGEQKKSSSSSRLVIYFSVITQTFKRTHTIHPSERIYCIYVRMQEYRNIRMDGSHRTFLSITNSLTCSTCMQNGFLLPRLLKYMYKHWTPPTIATATSSGENTHIRERFANKKGKYSNGELFAFVYMVRKVDWPNQTYWSALVHCSTNRFVAALISLLWILPEIIRKKNDFCARWVLVKRKIAEIDIHHNVW